MTIPLWSTLHAEPSCDRQPSRCGTIAAHRGGTGANVAELIPLSRMLKVFERRGAQSAVPATKGEQLDRFGRQPGPDRSAEERAVLLTWVAGWLDESPAARSGLTYEDRGEAYAVIRAGLEKHCAGERASEVRNGLERLLDFDASLLEQDSTGLLEYKSLRREIQMGEAGYQLACAEVCNRAKCESKAELMDALLTPIHAGESWPEIVERFAVQLNWQVWQTRRPDKSAPPSTVRVETQHDRYWWDQGFNAGVADVLPASIVANGIAHIQMPSAARMWARLAEFFPAPKPVMSRLLAAGAEVLAAAAQARRNPPSMAPAADYGEQG